MTQPSQRMPLIDALKALAALLVLLNHFSSYGPLAANLRDAWPGPFDWFYAYGRMAVQVFLVVAGFLAARALSPRGEALAAFPLPLIGKRYLRLVVPYLAALGLAVAAAAVADHWMDDDAVPARATLGQWLAHALLLHSLLGVEALSAGVWYIAIDFQLFALMALLLWSGRGRLPAMLPVLAVAAAALFWFNRNPAWDSWALYFFGSYGLGAAAWWAGDRRHLAAWLGVITTVVIAALIVDFRLRIEIALAVALLLGFARRHGWLERWPDVRPLAFLGRISYALFLVHFPVLLLANGLYAQSGLTSSFSALLGLALAVGASLIAATLFHRWIESPEASKRITAALGWLLTQGQVQLRRLPGVAALLTYLARS